MPTARLLDRVRKLLALATSPNEHEAAAAAARAQALIDEHRLLDHLAALDDAAGTGGDPITDARDAPLEASRRLRGWKVALATALADLNGCVAYTLDRGHDEAIVLVGRARDRAVVEELWRWLVQRIEWLSATRGEGQPRWWHDAFRVGVVDAVVARLAAQRAAPPAGVDARALAVLEPAMAAQKAALDDYVARHLRFGKGRGLRVDARAYREGHAASATLPLSVASTARGDPKKR